MGPFFIADPHFGHERIIELCHRPFDSVEQMNRVLIDNWNSVVEQRDDVHLLGDVFLKMNQKEAMAIREQLHGNIHLILGNHDQIAKKMPRAFAWTKESYFYTTKTPSKIAIYLHHFAHRSWPKSHAGAWHLFGHSHGELPEEPFKMSMDVGVDCNDFTPVSLDYVVERMKAKRVLQAARVDTLAWLDSLAVLARKATRGPYFVDHVRPYDETFRTNKYGYELNGPGVFDTVATKLTEADAAYLQELAPHRLEWLIATARGSLGPEEFRSPKPMYGLDVQGDAGELAKDFGDAAVANIKHNVGKRRSSGAVMSVGETTDEAS